MKILLTGIMVLSLFYSSAQAWELSLEPGYMVYNSDDIKDGYGAKIKLGHGPIYAWISEEQTTRCFRIQNNIGLDIQGHGIGGALKVYQGLLIVADIGKYRPKVKVSGDPVWIYDESEWYYFHYRIKSGYGGSIGLQYEQGIRDNWSIKAGLMYRHLRLKETTETLFSKNTNYWEFPFRDKSFSGVQVGVSVGYIF